MCMIVRRLLYTHCETDGSGDVLAAVWNCPQIVDSLLVFVYSLLIASKINLSDSDGYRLGTRLTTKAMDSLRLWHWHALRYWLILV